MQTTMGQPICWPVAGENEPPGRLLRENEGHVPVGIFRNTVVILCPTMLYFVVCLYDSAQYDLNMPYPILCIFRVKTHILCDLLRVNYVLQREKCTLPPVVSICGVKKETKHLPAIVLSLHGHLSCTPAIVEPNT